MRELPPAVRVLGHPVVASALTGLLVLGFLFFLQAGPGGIWAALILLIPAAWVGRCAQAVQRQRQWERAWDSMLPDAAPARPMRWVGIVAMALLIGLALWQGGAL